MVIWITGITASGKTSLGKALLEACKIMGVQNIIHLDGDELRKRPDWVKGHGIEDRFKSFQKIIDVTNWELEQGNVVIVSTVSHKASMRLEARDRLSNFYEVYLRCSSEECEKRDFKNFYSRAKNQSISDQKEIFPGVTEAYEESKNPEMVIDTEHDSLEHSKAKLLKYFMPLIQEYSNTFTGVK